jgi:hypothetical protein
MDITFKDNTSNANIFLSTYRNVISPMVDCHIPFAPALYMLLMYIVQIYSLCTCLQLVAPLKFSFKHYLINSAKYQDSDATVGILVVVVNL